MTHQQFGCPTGVVKVINTGLHVNATINALSALFIKCGLLGDILATHLFPGDHGAVLLAGTAYADGQLTFYVREVRH